MIRLEKTERAKSTVTPYTRAEINELVRIKSLPYGEKAKALELFALRFNRSVQSAGVKMSAIGREKTKSSRSTKNASVNEIVVPIKSFKVVGNNLHIIY